MTGDIDESALLSAGRATSAWVVLLGNESRFDGFAVSVVDERMAFNGLRDGDALIFVNDSAGIPMVAAFARLYRIRIASGNVQLFLDGLLPVDPPTSAASLGIAVGEGVPAISRLNYSVFEMALKTATGKSASSLPVIEGKTPHEQAYIRKMLQLAVSADLLGPANGPDEEIVGMSVRDRYLIGKLAPRTNGEEDCIEGLKGKTAVEAPADGDKAPADLVRHEDKRYDPGAEFNTAKGRSDVDDDDSQEVDASKNQSFIPSSMGLTFCVDQEVDALELEVRWGRYERGESSEKVGKEGKPLRAWKRHPAGGKVSLSMKAGPFRPITPDPTAPKVLIQGTVRAPLESGDRLVTVFLVNDQLQPEQNQDEAWLFQPEIILRHPEGKAVFRRRPIFKGDVGDTELDALEMLYREKVEFAVGHTVSVHAKSLPGNPNLAVEVRTSVLPESDVPVTEVPGIEPGDRAAMKRLVDAGALDMRHIGALKKEDLITSLETIVNDYAAWIEEQRARVGKDVIGHDAAAAAAMERCTKVLERLREGIATLNENEDALSAFRFANLAMADQRVRSIYALSRRRGKKVDLEDVDVPKNRTWRPFQLAFILLSIPALADPKHRDRTEPVDAYADLLWFPTGGGKTEAYLGVAAFTMALRRLQKDPGGLDSSRGLSVIMRYTLRMLTLQQFQRAATLICAMESLRRGDAKAWGEVPFTLGLWVGKRVTPNDTEDSHEAIKAVRGNSRPKSSSSPAQLKNCPWCGAEIAPGRDIEVRRFKDGDGRTILYCGDALGSCVFSRAKSKEGGLPVVVVDDEIYRRPPSMLIAVIDKFAMMAWRGQVRTLFGRATRECPRHGLLWPGSECDGRHIRKGAFPDTRVQECKPIRPPDLIIQDEFHLISGPLGTMVGLYETAVDELCSWDLDGKRIRPKVIASTATVRKAAEQINNVFMRRVSIFPPHGLDIEDNFFSIQRPIAKKPGRRYLGICAPGSARPAVLIRVYTAILTAGQEIFEHFGPIAADPYMTVVGYFNSLRELGGMKRLAEDDVQFRSYRVLMSDVARPGLAQRNVKIVDELTSRISNKELPLKLDQLEVPFKGKLDPTSGLFKQDWIKGEARAMDVVLATSMFSVGVDVSRLGLMVVNGQPKSTAEYIQSSSRVGRSSPGLVFTVLTWSRPRDLSHYESFEHYHSSFYKHVEAQSVTPFSPRSLDRGLTGSMLSVLRLSKEDFNPNLGAGILRNTGRPEIAELKKIVAGRGWNVSGSKSISDLTEAMIGDRCDVWVKEASKGGRKLGYEAGRRGKEDEDDVAGLLKKPGLQSWDDFTVPMSLREVEPGVRLAMNAGGIAEGPEWTARPIVDKRKGGDS